MQTQSDPTVESGLEAGNPEAETAPVTDPSPVTNPIPEPEPPVPAPGEILRKAREARGESLNDVARTLKLSAHQLEAIENGRFDILPGPTFVRGFLRNYARYLEIPPEPLLEGVGIRTPTAADLASMVKLHGNVQPKASPRARSRMLPVVLAVLVVLVLAGLAGAGFYKGWFKFKGLSEFRLNSATAASPHEKIDQPQKPAIYGSQELVGPEKPLTAVEAKLTVTDKFEIVTDVLEPPVLVNLAKDPTKTDGGAQASANSEATLRLLFNASTLVRVSDRSGKLIFTRTGIRGSTNSIKGKPPFSVTVNNANNVGLEFNGKAVDLKGHTGKDGVARLTLK